jgi:nucleoside-diphosphate-sugar epimerase
MKPVLITGATGFIGQHLQKTFLQAGVPVTALVRSQSANADAVLDGVNRISGDLSDGPLLTQTVSSVSTVIYCAGAVRGSRPEDFEPANIAGVRYLVEAMNAVSTEVPLLLISSLAASRPGVSDYANSKYLGEQEVVQHARFPWTIFRPSAVYGPGDKEMLPILKLARRGLITPAGPRNQRLSLIHVTDLAYAAAAWLKAWEKCKGQVFTLDDGHNGGYDWHEIATITSGGKYRRINIPRWLLFTAAQINLSTSRILGYAPMFTPGKAREFTQSDWVCNNTPLSEATDWHPGIALKKGVNELLGEPGGQNRK